MENTSYLGLSYEDLIFENKNKNYGSYYSRKSYEKNLFIGLILGASLFILLAMIPKIYSYFVPTTFKEVEIKKNPEPPILCNYIKEDPKIITSIEASSKIEVIKNTPPIIVDDVTVIEEIPTNDQLKGNITIGTSSQTGIGEGVDEKGLIFIESTQKEEPPQILVDVMPTFIGGDEALFAFIKEHIRYPQTAQDFNIQGKVFIQFVVGKDGKVSKPLVIRSIGGGCDEEALRIIGMMPEWIPGKQGGNAVPVYVRIPINFLMKD